MFCLAIQRSYDCMYMYLWSSNNDRSLDTHAGWLSMALPILLRASVFNRLRTSCSASVPAASLPIHSVARARWLVSSTDTWRARPECSNSSIWLPIKKIFHVWWMWFLNIYVPGTCTCNHACQIKTGDFVLIADCITFTSIRIENMPQNWEILNYL